MRAFAQLADDLDRTPRQDRKHRLLAAYFRDAPAADAAWALRFLYSERWKPAVRPPLLRQWVAESAGVPLWLIDACERQVGDLAETLALLLPPSPHPNPPSLARVAEQRLLPLTYARTDTQHALVRSAWSELGTRERTLWHKLLTGNLQVGVSPKLLAQALAGLAGIPTAQMVYRLTGDWQPTPDDFARLMAARDEPVIPYPFLPARPWNGGPHPLGPVTDWQLEWKWDGLRAQLMRRAGRSLLWSPGETILTASFPEIAEAATALPDGTVLEGMLLAWADGTPLPYVQLETRLQRSASGRKPRQIVPVIFMAWDLLECHGLDTRAWPLDRRRQELESLYSQALDPLSQRAGQAESASCSQMELPPLAPATPPPPVLRLSPILSISSWDDAAARHAQARARGTAGLILRRRSPLAGQDSQGADVWAWPVTPWTCDAVLTAMQPAGNPDLPERAVYTFAVWDGDKLVPVAKTSQGLTDAEFDALDAWGETNTLHRFGPVRSVKPELVFEIACPDITFSGRRKAGLILRAPRIVRRRLDKQPADADSLASLRNRVAAARGP